MDYKTRLQVNNTDLQSVLNTINTLPDSPSDSGTGLDTSDATATEADIANGKTAYVNGNKITGSMVIQAYYVGNNTPSNSVGNNGDLFLVRAGE